MRKHVSMSLIFKPVLILALAAFVFQMPRCSLSGGGDEESVTNPFLEDQSRGKEDTGYINMAGAEVEVTLEADIDAPSYNIFDAGPNLTQFAVTYLRKDQEFYLELIAEDATAPDRVEWRVDDSWISTADARSVETSKLTHLRIQRVNAVVLNRTAQNLTAGQVFQAKVPLKPYSIMSDAGDSCADENSHITLGQSVYWYLWNPDRSGCRAATQMMTLTVTTVQPVNPPSYPEYDKLWADGKLDVVVLFGELDDGSNIQNDYNWGNADRFCTWLEEGGFSEVLSPPLGKRFSKTAGAVTEIVDVYYPDVFRGLTDTTNFSNWQKAVSEHEVVIYLGHSVLGTGYAYEEVRYPSFYQIFIIGGCLGYEYYVRPVLAGKGGWENVDAVSSIVENYYSELNGVAGAFLAKLFWGLEHEGKASWQEVMAAINTKLGHAHFGVSGARDNCFTPQGGQCQPQGDRYENAAALPIPDNNPDGVKSTIDVPGSVIIGSLAVEVDITHTYAGDLQVILSHGEVDTVLWDRSGGSNDNIQQTFRPEVFNGNDAAGTWTLRVVDGAAQDTGTLSRWAIAITPQP